MFTIFFQYIYFLEPSICTGMINFGKILEYTCEFSSKISEYWDVYSMKISVIHWFFQIIN